MTETPPRAELVELLRWYAEMGVDAAVAETAIDWTQRADRAPGADAREHLRPSAPPARSPAPAPGPGSRPCGLPGHSAVFPPAGGQTVPKARRPPPAPRRPPPPRPPGPPAPCDRL